MTTSTLLPHDLLWLADAPGFARANALPAWASAGWLAQAPLVVRRDGAVEGRIPVGLRGTTRAQRHAAWLPAAQVARVVTPGMLARQARWRDHPRRAALPALAALARIAPQLDAAQVDWGVTGSVGFTLASGIDVLHAGSDLDLLVTAGTPLSAELARTLAALLDDAQARIDIQVATPFGAFALRERVRTGSRVLLKTATGPVMSQDPWQPQP
ncbi:malonate decarboxylase holo-ACP synthase [Cupriavidus sp. UME77]|uniref:malonate decarboxylase holo-ACP synthase n=1 Tax=Cupriavidus sp. UME77 TaxID=1862321 RepID=UPI0016049527|nr:malonate decarboxylase holo-ACP synthase [Cupriavidus sp. UME77]MBB1633240.1 phosphoribosyl-dephospho-CoA transferase [Cupriavidus sp. UME77]